MNYKTHLTVLQRSAALYSSSSAFKLPRLAADKSVEEWGLDPVCAQCYLGGLGIAKALTEGADIVICGRVSDASPIIGAAA